MRIELKTEPGKGQRATFLGHSRSGKTTLMQTLQAPMENVVVYDSKRVDWDTPNDVWPAGFAATFDYLVTSNPEDIRRHPRVIFKVDTRSLGDRAGWSREGTMGWLWTRALEVTWSRHPEPGTGSTLVVFDEAMHTLPINSHPDARRMFTQGSAVGLPAWLGTQAPLHVDTVALAESEHLFSFVQAIPEYRATLRQRRGVDAEVLATLERYEYAHNRLGDQTWREFAPVPIVKNAPKSTPREIEETVATQDFVALTQPEVPETVGG